MQVQGGRFRQHVVDDDAHAVAVDGLDGRAGAYSRCSPTRPSTAGQELAARVRGVQVELLDAVLHLEWELRQVRRHDRDGRIARFAGQARHEFAAIRGAAHGAARRGGRAGSRRRRLTDPAPAWGRRRFALLRRRPPAPPPSGRRPGGNPAASFRASRSHLGLEGKAGWVGPPALKEL